MDVQRHAIRAWAKLHGHTVSVWAADEGVSGAEALDRRLGLLEAMEAVQEHRVAAIVVYRIDRLAREMMAQEQLLAEVWRMGGRVHSVSLTEDAYLDPEGAEADPSRALVRRLLGALAEYERDIIRLRLRAGRQRKAARGGFVGGGVPLGYRNEDRELVADPDELATVERIVRLRSDGLSLPAICERLTVEGHRTKRGGRWWPYTVSLVLKRAGDEVARGRAAC